MASLCFCLFFCFAVEEPALVGREKKSDFRFSFPAAGKAARRQRKEGQSKIYLKGFEFSRGKLSGPAQGRAMPWGLSQG
jgi:hypothetical protein